MSGWGGGPWGLSPWGAVVDALRLERAVAIRENVVRLVFNVAPKFTRTLVSGDGSNPERYTITANVASVGLDGLPARPVRVVSVEVAGVEFSFGSVLDVTVDRPFSPYAASYTIAVNGLESIGGELLDPTKTSLPFLGLYRTLRVQSVDNPTPSRDVANPQLERDLENLLIRPGAILGTIPVGGDGDYAYDEGLANLRKRVVRRLITRPGGFASLPNYGVGVPSYGKRLAVAGIRQQIAAEAERQISLEPDVAAVRVTFSTNPDDPSVTLLDVRVRAQTGSSLDLQLPLSTG